MPDWLQVETRGSEPVTFRGTELTTFAQFFTVHLPFRIPNLQGSFTWGRPVSVLARTADGQEQIIPIPDVTRQALWSLAGACVLFAVLVGILSGRRH